MNTQGRFFRTNFVLWASIALLVAFATLARFVPAHLLLLAVFVALIATRSRHAANTEEPTP